MRIIDQVRLKNQLTVWPTIQSAWQRTTAIFGLDGAIPVDITNVYEWFRADWSGDDNGEKRQRLWGDLARDSRPSFDSAWFEWRMNRIDNSSGRPVKVDGRAVWAIAGLLDNEPDEWTMMLFERQDGRVCLTHYWSVNLSRATGLQIPLRIPFEDDLKDGESGFVCAVMAPVILTQSLMHCKNVLVEETPIPVKLAKKFHRNHKIRPAKWRAVKIEPMKKVIRRGGGVQNVGIEKAMHIVRGNFADYTEERPLFGKVTGRVFRQMHARGNSSIGVRKPGYVVEPPKKVEAEAVRLKI